MKARFKFSCSIAAILSACGAAHAADTTVADASASSGGIEEIVVTAQRRQESIQNVPNTIQAISGNTLEQLNVTDLSELLQFTPNVTFGNNGPGQGVIFMRGLSAGLQGNQSSATIANFPNVALYLDDQSMQFPGRNVDIYAVDLDRIEVLEGPQGTLFGGGAEAGALRYITNKPKLDKYEGNAEASYGTTAHGDDNDSVNAMFNIPVVRDKFAVRAVIYNDRQGGYIDNVPSTFTRSTTDLGNFYFNIKPGSNGLCPNGQPAGVAGYCALPNAPQGNNQALVAKAQNPTTYTGGRVSALYEINDDWNALIQESLQHLDAEGLSVEYPIGSDFQPLAPLEVTNFSPSYDRDQFVNSSWTVNGKLGPLNAVYTGGYMDRRLEQQMEYSNYSRTVDGAYYECTGGSTGWGSGAPVCYSPVGYWHDKVRNTHLTEEFRVSTPDNWLIRGITGVYYEDFKIYDVMNFDYKTIPSCNPANLAAAKAGGAPCVADVAPAPGATTNDPSIRGDATAFGEDTQRGYNQWAIFGSFDYDIIPKVLTITGGTRWYRYSNFEVGSQYATGTGCLNVPNGQCVGGLVNIDNAHDHSVYSGFRSRANITWHIDSDTMTYFTFSQGFRPGGFNRSSSGVATGANGAAQYQKPLSYAPDSLTNYEIGLKSEFLDHRLQLNLSAYYMQWTNVQLLFFNPTELGNTTFGVNGPDYNIKGGEAQLVAKVTDNFTIQGSASYNDSKQSNSPCLIDNIPGTPAYQQCITQVQQKGVGLVAFLNPFGALGTVPAFSPTFQGNIRGRYEQQIGEAKGFAQVSVNYTGSMYNEPATYPSGNGVLIPNTTLLRYLQPSYTTFDAAIGCTIDKYTAQIYGTNLGNSQASTLTSSEQFIKTEVPLRPRVIGLKLSAAF